jgi:hypothetical protein
MIIPPSVFNQMFQKFPRFTTAVVIIFVGFPYGFPLYQYLYPPKTFEDGERQGMLNARDKIKSLAKDKCTRTRNYIKDDALKIKNGEIALISEKDLEGKIKIAILPRWNLTLLDDKYVVRMPLKADWNEAWLMTEEESNEIDIEIEEMLKDTKFAIKGDIKKQAKGNISNAAHRTIDEHVSKMRGP